MESVLKGRPGFVTVLSWLPMLFAQDEDWAVPACAVRSGWRRKAWACGSRVVLGLWLGLPAPSRFGNQGLGKLRGCLFLERKYRFNLHDRKQVRVYKARHVVPIELTGMIPDIFFDPIPTCWMTCFWFWDTGHFAMILMDVGALGVALPRTLRHPDHQLVQVVSNFEKRH